jgi:hypothetical protein
MERKKRKNFDALAFKARAQAEISKETQGMTPEQRCEYFRRGAESGPMGDWVKKVKKATEERKKRSGQA